MSTIFFHIGYHRTGTTYFQSFLAKYRENLKELGCLVPDTGYDGLTHSQLALSLPSLRSFNIEKIKPGFSRSASPCQTSGPNAFELFQELKSELQSSGVDRAIISSECFLEWLDVSELRRVLVDPKIETKILVLLRRQDRWIESVYSQLIKDPVFEFAGDFESMPQHNMLDFNRGLEPWINQFGEENLSLIFYEENCDAYATTRNILNALELKIAWDSGEFHPRKATFKNSSLDEVCVEVLRHLNSTGLVSANVHRNVREQSDSFRRNHIFRKWRLSRVKSEKLMSKYCDSNNELFTRLRVSPPKGWGEIENQDYSNPCQKNQKIKNILSSLTQFFPPRTIQSLKAAVENSFNQ